MTREVENLVRENIKRLKRYSSARDEFSGEASVFLDANENAFGSPAATAYNRYPDPLQQELKNEIARLKKLKPANIFLGNGSDEAIDLLFRIFCEPGKDNVIYCPPSYGMYEVCAAINDIELRSAPLKENFQLDLAAIARATGENTKLLFICSPNNPTANSMDHKDIFSILSSFPGLVVIDEAYIDYASNPSFKDELLNYKNLVVLQTFSKAWGLAALRLGMAFADESIIRYMNNVKYPYNINAASQQIALGALQQKEMIQTWIEQVIEQRKWLAGELQQIPAVIQVYPSDANFILVKIKEANKVYRYLTSRGIITRDRSKLILCDDCLRITIGTPGENRQLIEALKEYK